MCEKTDDLPSMLKSSFSQSTIHGLDRMIENSCVYRRTFWGTFLVVFIGILSYLEYDLFKSYLKYETKTSVNTVVEDASVFPIITFCDLDQFTKDLSIQLLNQNGFTSNTSFRSDSPENTVGVLSDYSVTSTLAKYTFASILRSSNDSVIQKLRNKIDETIVSCRYNNNECNQADFSHVFHTLYGFCIQFNPNVPIKLEGPINGLQIDMLLDPINKNNHFSDERGLVIMIRNNTEDTDDDNGSRIPVKERSLIGIERTFMNELPKPFSNCYMIGESTSEFDDIIKSMNRSYITRYCFYTCVAKYLAENCSCYVNGYYKFNAKIPCDSSQESTQCYFDLFKEVRDNKNKYCGDECPLECQRFEYITSVSSASFDSDYYAIKLLDEPFVKRKYPNISSTELKENMISFYLYFNSLQYEEFQQLPAMSFVDLVSSFGGTLGLFIGASFISFFELFEGSALVLIWLCKRARLAHKKTKEKCRRITQKISAK